MPSASRSELSNQPASHRQRETAERPLRCEERPQRAKWSLKSILPGVFPSCWRRNACQSETWGWGSDQCTWTEKETPQINSLNCRFETDKNQRDIITFTRDRVDYLQESPYRRLSVPCRAATKGCNTIFTRPGKAWIRMNEKAWLWVELRPYVNRLTDCFVLLHREDAGNYDTYDCCLKMIDESLLRRWQRK